MIGLIIVLVFWSVDRCPQEGVARNSETFCWGGFSCWCSSCSLLLFVLVSEHIYFLSLLSLARAYSMLFSQSEVDEKGLK